jgi:hypothetical protein
MVQHSVNLSYFGVLRKTSQQLCIFTERYLVCENKKTVPQVVISHPWAGEKKPLKVLSSEK